MLRFATCLAVALALAACDSDTATDAGVHPDAAVTIQDAAANPDATATDSGTTPDSGAVAADSGAVTPDAGTAADAGLLPFAAVCADNTQCETGLCYQYGARGQRCTAMCVNGTCPVPPMSQGCNNMGVCRVP